MRIAILTELFSPNIGGQEIRYAELTHVLSRRGHSVDIFCIQSDPTSPAHEILEDATIHRYPSAPDYQRPALKWFRRQPWTILRYALSCRRIDPEVFDLFIFNEWPLLHIMLAPSRIRTKALIDWCEFRNGALFALFQRYLPRKAAGNLANTAALKGRLESLSRCSFHVLPGGIFSERYHSNPTAQRSGIFFLGRITEHKNLGLLLSAYEALLSKGYSGPLRIAGDGPQLSSLRRWIQKSEIGGKVEILGAVDEEKKQQLLASSELFLLTSRREGFPRVIAEAIASGLPIVTARYPENGAAYVVDDYKIGEVTDPTVDAVSDGVLRVLEKWDSYSAACIEASRFLDWEALADNFLELATRISRPQ